MKTIEIIIGPAGETKVETKGFAGDACRAASRWLEQAIGRRTTEQMTAEYYQARATDPSLEQSP